MSICKCTVLIYCCHNHLEKGSKCTFTMIVVDMLSACNPTLTYEYEAVGGGILFPQVNSIEAGMTMIQIQEGETRGQKRTIHVKGYRWGFERSLYNTNRTKSNYLYTNKRGEM